ncbi:hypothetical protein AUEXF2481DRAFT_153253 [Aureobasidium subglaciale EXF-2481]|uniref:Uncharacterized protein n=1 Tax=Aureobasidium subglaciale (strain EXF-2481) TaxID=1043005 RepID=A0A074Z363_AURSE|nr:uncharacterized protein AUEXF2481DRAFT_153253 [Aureobasidium subglaciale EXF-2481]KER00713.1 hypothetical protein AUEXF2481DRAFT_153253 [Aureobasidium subglaciale EXF-2481]
MARLGASLPHSYQDGHLICTIQDSFTFTTFLFLLPSLHSICLFPPPHSCILNQAFSPIQITFCQQSITSPDSINPSPQPLNLPPSRARNKLAQRLAARAAAAEETSASPTSDPDALDATAIQAAFDLSVEPLSDLPDLDLSAVTERQINELIGVNSEGRVVSAYSTSSSDPSSASSSSDEENSFGRDEASVAESAQNDSVMPGVKRRPSTTEAKKRIPLDDEEEEATTSSSARSRIGLQRQISDPFQSPENSSGEEGSSSSSSEEEELMFGRKERVLGVE